MDTSRAFRVNTFSGQWCAQHSVPPTSGSLRVFKQFAWLEVGSVKAALSRPTHQRVTQTVGRLYYLTERNRYRNQNRPGK